MRVVVLVSGGKDSLYNLIECVCYGHEIVALGNLQPFQSDSSNTRNDELDSEMFQTVGWNGITYIAKCLNLPLFVKQTMGVNTQNTLIYDHNKLSSKQKKRNNRKQTKYYVLPFYFLWSLLSCFDFVSKKKHNNFIAQIRKTIPKIF